MILATFTVCGYLETMIIITEPVSVDRKSGGFP